VIKNHPLDTGLVPYKRIIKQLEQQHKIEGRVIYLEDGYLPTMLHNSKGTVLVNSTVGTSSLFHGIPTCVLGDAIYDMEGLTYQGGLDKFWTKGTRPNPALFGRFSKAIIHLTQVNGDFYSKKGIDMSVEGSMRFFNLPPVKDKVSMGSGMEIIDFIRSAPNKPPKVEKNAYVYIKH
jgi:capsular polysaccharide export protein